MPRPYIVLTPQALSIMLRTMGVPFLDIKRQIEPLKKEIMMAIEEVIDGGAFILGKQVQELEEAIAKLIGATGAVGVSSGSDALLVSLMALGVKGNQSVITTPFTFFATAGAIARLGATPIFVDIEPDTFNISPEKALEAVRKDTVGFLPVHLFGHMADLKPILDFAKQKNLFVVEDSAQSILSESPLGFASTIGTMGIFSFFPTKNLGGFGDGGMVVTMDNDLREHVRILRNHGAKPKYHHLYVGGNFRLDTLHAGILLVLLPRLKEWTEKRRGIAKRYVELFEQTGLCEKGLVTLPCERPGFRHVYNQFVIRARRRDELCSFLREKGIGFAIYYPEPLHLQPCFSYLGYKEGDFPEAERACKEVIALPIFPELTKTEQEEVVGRVKDFYNQ